MHKFYTASYDATIYYQTPKQNTGIDPILEVSVKNSQDGVNFLGRTPLTENPYYTYDLAANSNYSVTDAYFPASDIRRAVLQFSQSDINKLYTYCYIFIVTLLDVNNRSILSLCR